MESVEDAWAKINFNGKVAYVNANYLEEVEVGNLAEKDENLSFLKIFCLCRCMERGGRGLLTPMSR